MSTSAPPRRSRPLLILAVVAVLAVALTATGLLWWRSGGGEEEADALATALATGDFTGVEVTGLDAEGSAAERDRALGAFQEAAGSAPQVEVTGVEDGEDGTRVAGLHWTWTFAGTGEAGEVWEYDTTAVLERADGGWAARLAPAVLAPGLAEGQHLERRAVMATPGEVTDRDGTVLFGPVDVLDLGLDKAAIAEDEQEQAARDLAELLGTDGDNLVAAVEAAGDEAFVTALTIRASAAGDYPLDRAGEVPGYLAREDSRPLATERGYAPGVLGALRQATAEDIEDSDGEIAAGDLVATGGVVAARREQVAGVDGLEVVAVADAGAEGAVDGEEPLFTTAPTDGTTVTTTLDDDLQRAATAAIADEDSPAAVVVLQPSTGDVLAAALGPDGQEYPIGLVGQYAPGSTFKAVTALGLLRAGLTPESEVQCPETATVEGRSFKNADSLSPDLFGTMTLAEAIAHSCNTAMLLESDTVDQAALAEAATTLGMGQESPEGLDAFLGSVDPEDTGTEHAAAMMGQGRVLASPLAMATVIASVQQGGTVTPRILADDDSGPVEVSAPLTAEETTQMQGLLRGVVTDGSLDDFADLSGEPVIGKTGTAEWTDEDGETKLHSWVIVAQGDLAVAVFVEDGSYGSVTAGPIAREVLEAAA